MSALVFWFTGLSGAGKSTIAQAVSEQLTTQGVRVLILDGDYVRAHLHVHLGFSREDIIKNNALIAQLCQKNRDNYDVILVPIISPYLSSRKDARQLLSPGFYEVYCCASLDVVVKRDTKGLYAKAKRREITDMIGYSPESVYEAPKNPDYVIDSGVESEEASVKGFQAFIRRCQEERKR